MLRKTIALLVFTSCLVSLIEGNPLRVDSQVKESCENALKLGLQRFGGLGVKKFKRPGSPVVATPTTTTTADEDKPKVEQPIKVDVIRVDDDDSASDDEVIEEVKSTKKSKPVEAELPAPVHEEVDQSREDTVVVEAKEHVEPKSWASLFKSEAVAAPQEKQEPAVDPEIEKKLKIMLSNEDIDEHDDSQLLGLANFEHFDD